MARNFRELEAGMSPQRLSDIRAVARRDMQGMLVSELRRCVGRGETSVAAELGIDVQSLSDSEFESTASVDTLRRLVHALGGELEFVVRLPDREVRLEFETVV